MSEANHPAFDQVEQAILSKLVQEDVIEGEGIAALPVANTPAPDATTVAQADAAAPIPAPASEAAATQAPATAEAPAVTQTPAQAATQAPQGDTRAALRAARTAERRLRDENDRLRAENEAIKQGKVPVSTEISDEDIAQLEEDFPLQAKIARQQREIARQLAEQRQVAQPAPEFEPLSYDSTTQDVIDSVPQLVAWQYDPTAQEKFNRAIEYDKALVLDPDWKDKSVAERFTEAARRTEAALAPTAASPAPTPSAATAATAATTAARLDPAAVVANAQVEGPKGISDFRGGAPANMPTVNYATMSDEAIMASLPAS